MNLFRFDHIYQTSESCNENGFKVLSASCRCIAANHICQIFHFVHCLKYIFNVNSVIHGCIAFDHSSFSLRNFLTRKSSRNSVKFCDWSRERACQKNHEAAAVSLVTSRYHYFTKLLVIKKMWVFV